MRGKARQCNDGSWSDKNLGIVLLKRAPGACPSIGKQTIGQFYLSYINPLLTFPTFLMILFFHQLAGLFSPKIIHHKTMKQNGYYWYYLCTCDPTAQVHTCYLNRSRCWVNFCSGSHIIKRSMQRH